LTHFLSFLEQRPDATDSVTTAALFFLCSEINKKKKKWLRTYVWFQGVKCGLHTILF
jgi:hypothetical protein